MREVKCANLFSVFSVFYCFFSVVAGVFSPFFDEMCNKHSQLTGLHFDCVMLRFFGVFTSMFLSLSLPVVEGIDTETSA